MNSKGKGRRTEETIGLLRVRIIRGVNLAYRDTRGSDPYVILRLGNQKLKTNVKKKNVNPEWNEDLTLSISEPIRPIRLEVYDRDLFSKDDPMGDTELDILPFITAVTMVSDDFPDNSLLKSVQPSKENFLVAESNIRYKDGKVVQDAILRLQNVESGELELQLHWVNLG